MTDTATQPRPGRGSFPATRTGWSLATEARWLEPSQICWWPFTENVWTRLRIGVASGEGLGSILIHGVPIPIADPKPLSESGLSLQKWDSLTQAEESLLPGLRHLETDLKS